MSLPASPVFRLADAVLKRGRRRTRKFTPEGEKDAVYRQKRRKNNKAAKRSRDKRKLYNFMLEQHVTALREENIRLRAGLLAIKDHYGLLYTANQQGYCFHPGLVIPMHAFNSMTGFLLSCPVGTYHSQLPAPPLGSPLEPLPASEVLEGNSSRP